MQAIVTQSEHIQTALPGQIIIQMLPLEDNCWFNRNKEKIQVSLVGFIGKRGQ